MEIKATSPLTKQQLLIPRVLCIGTETGTNNDTSHKYISGDIIEFTNIGVQEYPVWVCDKFGYALDFYESFPHLFKPLPWWYGRTVEDMPLYLIDKFGKVKRVLRHNTDFMTVIFNDDDWEESYAHYQPADESDYQEYQKQKQ